MRDFLNRCRKIEQTMGEAYRLLAGAPGYSRELRDLFLRLARDEDDHAAQLDMARGVPGELFFSGPGLDVAHLEELQERAGELLRLAADPPRDHDRVIGLARDLEGAFLDVHLQNAARFRDRRVAELFHGLARDDRDHLEDLESFAGDLPDPSPAG